jgi:23S rRNA pseudouridine2605 synthase
MECFYFFHSIFVQQYTSMGQFDKFKQEKVSGARKKEMLKQQKRKAKKETEDFFKEKRATSKPSGHFDAQKISAMEPTAKSGGKSSQPAKSTKMATADSFEQMPLNKYLAHSSICSRREAAEKIKAGEVKVNDAVLMNPAYKVQATDIVKFNGKKIEPRQQMVYILLNKPKDFITTAEDDRGRKTVLDIVKGATEERIFPVGRLDRNTTGVLLLTNDGDLAQQLTHPSFEVRKIYEVTLDKPVAKTDLEKLLEGVTLEDGFVAADAAGFSDTKDKCVVGVEIHSGKNRVVRRMFEHLGYDVRNLDRVMFANLTKKNVERGKWRFLSEKEVRLLKFFNKSKRKQKPDRVELQDTPFVGNPAKKKPQRNVAPKQGKVK